MADTSEDVASAFWETVDAVEEAYNAHVYFYSGIIDDDGFGKLAAQVAKRNDGSRPNALLILTTFGGVANSAFQIARLLQNGYQKFLLYCPSHCKSAGTLVALGSHVIIMDDFSELGPLDVQLVKQNEIMARKSGLLARSSFEALSESAFELYERLMISITLKSGGNVSFKLASELSAQMAATMMAPVYAQINPEIVGGEKRDLDIAFEYGRRLAECSGNADLETIYALVHNYPAHDFIIDAYEAKDLFERVEYPSDELYEIVSVLSNAAYSPSNPSLVRALVRPTTTATGNENEGSSTGPESSNGDSGESPMDASGNANRRRNQSAANEDERSSGSGESPKGQTDIAVA